MPNHRFAPPSKARMIELTSQSAMMELTSQFHMQPESGHGEDSSRQPSIVDASISALQTALIQLSPAFLAALRELEPKKRQSKVRYVIATALLVVAVAIGADPGTRMFVTDKGHDLVARFHAPTAQPAAAETPAAEPSPAPVALPVIAAPVIAAPAVAVPVPPVSVAASAARDDLPATADPARAAKPSPKRGARSPSKAPRHASSKPEGADGF